METSPDEPLFSMAAVSSAFSFRAIAIDAKARIGQPASDTQAQSAASAGHDDITHGDATSFPDLGDRQCRDEIDGGRDFVRRGALAAKLQDVVPGVCRSSWFRCWA